MAITDSDRLSLARLPGVPRAKREAKVLCLRRDREEDPLAAHGDGKAHPPDLWLHIGRDALDELDKGGAGTLHWAWHLEGHVEHVC